MEQFEKSEIVPENKKTQPKILTMTTRSRTKMDLNSFSHLAKRPAITIYFSDVYYTVGVNSSSEMNGKKEILKGISGCFKKGELTAIIGPSGAGKSTLMNAIAGYVNSGVTGSIRTNSHLRNVKQFQKLSAYIMQDDLLQPQLSVEELMTISADLKIGKKLSKEKKKQVVDEILNSLGLSNSRQTRTEKLSGGERKRLSIAVELVNNPPVIFLDEPTTGLDVVSVGSLINLLQDLAKDGRTIICSLHQPSASVFEQFDHVYVMAKGSCVYQGTHDQLVPFLAKTGYQCPVTYNPADYIIELLHDEDESCIDHLSNEIQNGKMFCESPKSHDTKMVPQLSKKPSFYEMPDELLIEENEIDLNFYFLTNFFQQFWILLRRMMIQQIRNKTSLWISGLYHLLVGSAIGTFYIGVGNDANRFFDNFKYVLCVLTIFMYTNVWVPVLLAPTEIQFLEREYFNRWYGLKSYFIALTVSTIPRQVICGTVVCLICYFFANQPNDIWRYLMFELTCLLLGITSEGFGLTLGCIFNVTNGSVIAAVMVSVLGVLGIYGMGFGTAMDPFMEFLMSFSYFRYAIVAVTTALLGHNRPELYCDYEKEIYCHYAHPQLILRDLGMEGSSTRNQIVILVGFALLFRLTAFLVLRFRLTPEFSSPIFEYVRKVKRHILK